MCTCHCVILTLPLCPLFGFPSHLKWLRPQPTWDQAPWDWAPATAPSSPCSMCPTIARTSTSPAAQPPWPPTPSSSRPQPSRPPSRHCPHPRPQPSLSLPRPPRPPPPRKSLPRRRRSRVGQRWRNHTPALTWWKMCPPTCTLAVRYLIALLSLMLVTI